MVKLMGHMAIGLLFAIPAWFVWDGRVRFAFIGFVLATVMLPDVDLALRAVVPGVEHHGVTHTVLFVAVVSVIVGAVVGRVAAPLLERWWYKDEEEVVTETLVRRFVIGGLFVGGISHLFGDMLSAPDIAQPIEPLWPLFQGSIGIDVIYYSSDWWNLGLLLFALLVHLGLAVRFDGLPLQSNPPENA